MQQFQMSEGRIGPTSFVDILGPEAPSFRRVKSSQCLHFDSGLGGSLEDLQKTFPCSVLTWATHSGDVGRAIYI